MSDPHTVGSTFDSFPSAKVSLQIAHILPDINKTQYEALKFGHLQMLEDLGRKGALLEVHDRLSKLNSWDKDSPAPQDPHHAFIKREYWSLVEKEKQTRMILRDQELEYHDAVIEQDKLLKQHYEAELENQERMNTALKDKHELSDSLHEKEVRVLSEENRTLKEDRYKLEMQLADIVVLSEDVRALKDGLVGMKQNHDDSLAFAHRHAKSNEALRKNQNELETQARQLEQQLSDHHEALNAMRKEFSGLIRDIPAQVKYREEYVQGLKRKLVQMETKLNQLSAHDHQQFSFNETLNEKQTILEQQQRKNIASLEKQASFNEGLSRKQKVTLQLINDCATRVQVLEGALTNLEGAQTDNSTNPENSKEAPKETVMRLERDQRREYSALSETKAAGIEALGNAVTILDKDQTLALVEPSRPGFPVSLNKKQADLEDELEDTAAMMRRLNHQFNLLLLYLFLLVLSGLICAAGFWPARGFPDRGR